MNQSPKIEPIGLSEKETDNFIQQFMAKVPYDVRHSYSSTSVMLNQMKFGYDAHYLKIVQANVVKGILCFNMDHTCHTEFRAYIRNFSLLKIEDYPEMLSLVVDYIWNKSNADTIRVDLYHFKEEGNDDSNIKASNEIKDALSMNRLGFKWKTLINDPSGLRFQIMQMNRPKNLGMNEKEANARKLKLKQEPLTIKAGLLLNLCKETET